MADTKGIALTKIATITPTNIIIAPATNVVVNASLNIASYNRFLEIARTPEVLSLSHCRLKVQVLQFVFQEHKLLRFESSFKLIIQSVINTTSLFYKISIHTFIAVAPIRTAKIICKTFVFIFCPDFAPRGAAIRLAIIMIKAGK